MYRVVLSQKSSFLDSVEGEVLRLEKSVWTGVWSTLKKELTLEFFSLKIYSVTRLRTRRWLNKFDAAFFTLF